MAWMHAGLTELKARLVKWHQERYGVTIDMHATLAKLGEEYGEFMQAYLAYLTAKNSPEEALAREMLGNEIFDVIAVLFHLGRGCGVDVPEAVVRKLTVIENRPVRMHRGVAAEHLTAYSLVKIHDPESVKVRLGERGGKTVVESVEPDYFTAPPTVPPRGGFVDRMSPGVVPKPFVPPAPSLPGEHC